jgi:hypothetical protein
MDHRRQSPSGDLHLLPFVTIQTCGRRQVRLLHPVRSTSLPESVDDFCFDSLRRLLAAASPRVEQADGGLGPRLPDPPIAEAWAAPIPPRVVSPIRETSSDAVGSSAAGTAQTRQHSLPRGGRLLVGASGSQRVCWRTYDRRAELAVWSCRVRRSVAARAASFSRRPGGRVTPQAVTPYVVAASAEHEWSATDPPVREVLAPERVAASTSAGCACGEYGGSGTTARESCHCQDRGCRGGVVRPGRLVVGLAAG